LTPFATVLSRNNFTVDERKCFFVEFKYFSPLDNVEDNEDKNLSWLFNFKLDEIANLSPEIKRKRTSTNHHQQHQATQQQQQVVENHQQQIYYNPSQQQPYDDTNQQRSAKDPCIEDDLNVAENIVISNAPMPYSSHT
jgi:hypothetical protein